MKYIWMWISVVGGAELCGAQTVRAPISASGQEAPSATVAPVEWNWATMKVRFTGKAWPETPEESYASVEKRALAVGLADAIQVIQQQHQSALTYWQASAAGSGDSAEQAGQRMSRAAYIYNTEYFADGSVRLSLESNLAAAFVSAVLPIAIEKAAGIQGATATGVVLRSNTYIAPLPFYEVEAEGGEVLFGIQQVARDAYQKNLMGHWLTRTDAGKIEGLGRVVGKKPIYIEIRHVSGNRFRVIGAKWKEALAQNQVLLENARIAIVTPPAP